MKHPSSFPISASATPQLKRNSLIVTLLAMELFLLCAAAEAANVAESKWKTVPLGGGGYVTGLVSDATGSSIYCRTDVGGAFRWNAVRGEWVSITDKIVPSTTEHATNLMRVCSNKL